MTTSSNKSNSVAELDADDGSAIYWLQPRVNRGTGSACLQNQNKY